MKILKNSFFRIILTTFNLIVPAITGMYIARLLDVQVFGEFNKANSVLALFMIFCSFGIYDYGIREIGKVQNDQEAKDSIFTSLFTIGSIANTIGLIAFFIYTTFFVSSYQTIYYILLINIFSNIFNIEWINEGMENYKFITIKTIIIRVIYVVSLFVFVRNPDDVKIYTLLLSLSLFINNIVSYIYLKKRIHFNFRIMKLRKHFKNLIVMTVIININFLYIQFDKVMLGQYIGGVAVSSYQIPLFITETIFNVLLSILIVTIPKLSYYSHNNQEKDYKSLLKRSTNAFYLIAIPAAFGLMALSAEVITIYGGEKYLYVVPVMACMCIYKLIGTFDYVLSQQIMYIKNKQNKLMIFVGIGGVLNLLGNYFLINLGMYSAFSSIIKTTLIELVVILMIRVYIKRQVKLSIKLIDKSKILYFAASFCFLPICFIVKEFITNIYLVSIICVTLCSGFYVILLLLLKDENIILIKDTVIGLIKGKLAVKVKER